MQRLGHIGLDQETMDLEKLATLVQEIKGYQTLLDDRHQNP